MVKELMHDPIFLSLKSELATKDDLPVAQDLLDTLTAHKDGCVGMAANMIGVSRRIKGIAAPVDSFPVEAGGYDIILAASVLEHLDARESAIRKMREIADGVRPGGAAMILMNTGVREWDADTGEKLDAQFEVNIPPEEVRALLAEFFRGWEVLWDKCIHYEYPVPRGERVAVISSEVVTFTARRPQ